MAIESVLCLCLPPNEAYRFVLLCFAFLPCIICLRDTPLCNFQYNKAKAGTKNGMIHIHIQLPKNVINNQHSVDSETFNPDFLWILNFLFNVHKSFLCIIIVFCFGWWPERTLIHWHRISPTIFSLAPVPPIAKGENQIIATNDIPQPFELVLHLIRTGYSSS